ncbi:hypothetical protein MSPP1_002679 [Malassezia sp. CBS 17886]|nr:hypothetical protein MSPP1_002679 [Malassezia sp. CBS 17886]
MSPIPVAVLGYGNSARTFHIPFIGALPDAFYVAVVLQRARRAGSSAPVAAADLPGVQVAADIGAALAALPEGEGLVVITTDNASHFPYAKQALEHGKHVLVEKPVAVDEKDVVSLELLARSKGLVCTAYQNRRFDGDLLTLQTLLRDTAPSVPSALGVPTYFESRFDRFRPMAKGGWREEVDPETQGGGTLWDLGAHLVDQAVSIFGPPESVFGLMRNQRGQGSEHVDDDWLAVLSYPRMNPLPGDAHAPGTRPQGLRVVLGSTCLSTHTDAEQPRFRVEGTHGSYVKTGTDPQESQLKRGWLPGTHGDAFGAYEDTDPAAVRFGRLTTSQRSDEPATPANPPKLAACDIPTLPGRYLNLYINLYDTIRAAEDARARGASVDQVNTVIDGALLVRLDQAATTTRVLRLIRQSAEEGRVLPWTL